MKLKHILIGSTLLCCSVSAFAQKVNFSAVISGKDAPATLKLKELNGDWRRMKFVGLTMTGSGMEGLTNLMSNLGPLMQVGMMSEMGKGAAKNAGGGAGMDAIHDMSWLLGVCAVAGTAEAHSAASGKPSAAVSERRCNRMMGSLKYGCGWCDMACSGNAITGATRQGRARRASSASVRSPCADRPECPATVSE